MTEIGFGQHVSNLAVQDSQRIAVYIEEETHTIDTTEWLKSLPSVSKIATEDLKTAVQTKDFRVVDSSMWQ